MTPFPSSRFRAGVLRIAIAVFVASLSMAAFAADKPGLFYYVPSDDGWESLTAHADKISILAPQVFIVDASGQIHGDVEPRVRSLAAEHGMQLVPLLANLQPEVAHAILADEARRHQVVAETLRLCQASSCAGIQVDIEGVVNADSNLFTSFVREVADAFHAQNLSVSVAIPSPLFKTTLSANKYQAIFAGFGVDPAGYQLDQIARSVDFVTLMLYGEYGQGTPPGPVAGQAWVEQSLRYVLRFVPAQKLSLGVGLWAQSWCNQQVTYRRYAELQALNAAALRNVRWDNARRSPWVEYDDKDCHTVVWFENRRSVKEKLKLISQYHLWGFSAWRLGQEDPEIWKEVSTVRTKPKPD